MTYSIQEVNGCTKKLVFNFDKIDLSNEIKTALTSKRKSVNLKGFRKGKAPLGMVEQIYGPQIESDALNSFVQNQLYDAISKEELRVVGYPKFENMKYDSGKSVSFDAVVEIFPEVEVEGLKGLSFNTEKVEVKDTDIEESRKQLLSSKVEMVEVKEKETALANGHFAILNFEGEKADGEKPENMKGSDFQLEIGSGQFIPGFEEGMVGMKSGEKKTIELTFPEDYQAEDLQGAKVKFHVELLEIKEKKFPEFTEELSKELGFDSIEDFEKKTKENLLKQKDRAAKEKLHQEILEKLVELNSFDVPLTLIAQQENHLKEDVKGTLSSQGFNESMMTEYFEKWGSDLTTKAQFQVRSGLILESLAKKYNIETSDSDFDKKLEEIAAGSGLELDQIKKYYTSDPKMKNNLLYAVKEEKTFEKIREEIEVKEV